MEWFFFNLACFDSWLHQTVIEPVFAAVCRWLKLTRINLVIGLFAIFSALFFLGGLVEAMPSSRHPVSNPITLIIGVFVVGTFGFWLLPLFKAEKITQLPILSEIALNRMRQIRPAASSLVPLVILLSPVFFAVRPEKHLSDIFGVLIATTFLFLLHSMDLEDLSKS